MSTAQPWQPMLDSDRASLRGEEPAHGTPRQIGLLAVLIFVVAVAVTVAHWPALSARALTFDDNEYLVVNPLVQKPSWDSAGRFLREVLAPSTVEGYYQPLAMISLMLDFAQAKSPENLRPFHRTSLTLHVLNTCLVIVFLYLLFGQPWVAALVGLLFGVHPLTVEPIPWVGERKTVLATFFALWSFVLYIVYARRRGGSLRGSLLYGGALGTFVLALLSKPTTTPLPALLLLLDYWPLRRLSWRSVAEKVPFFVIAGVSAVITYVSQAHTGAAGLQENPWVRTPLILCHNIVFYLYKIVWPTNLSPHYPRPMIYNLSQPMLLAGVIGTAVLAAVLVISLRWTRAVVTGWLFFFVAILPTMQIIGFSNAIASDKYAYLPALGLLMTLAYALGRLWDSPAPAARPGLRRGAVVASALVLAGVGALGVRRQLDYWSDTERLYARMLEIAPQAAIVHSGYGAELAKQGRTREALEHFLKAIEIDPRGYDQHYNLGVELSKLGRIAQAAEHFRAALWANPNAFDARYNLAVALSALGRSAEAAEEYRRALVLNPNSVGALNNLGQELARQGDSAGAIAQFEAVLRITPGDAQAEYNLALVLGKLGRADAAIEHLKAAVRGRPEDPTTHYMLGVALAQHGHVEEAAAHLREAVRLQEDYLEARMSLGACLFRLGQREEAAATFREVIQRHPDFAGAYRNLGLVLESEDRQEEAIRVFEAGLAVAPADEPLRAALQAAQAGRAAQSQP